MDQDFDKADILYGVPEIAAFMGMTARQVYHLRDSGALPTFTLPGGGKVCARRSTLNAWLAEQEAKAKS